MTNIELAKQELQKVGATLSKEISNPAVKQILLKLKSVNTDLTKLINGEESFSFDDFNEGTQQQQKPKMKEQNSFGVDLGSFDNFVSQKDPNTFDWRQTMREANGNGEVNLGDWNPNTPANADTLGRMIDRT